MEKQLTTAIEVWGGMECTINRVQNDYFDQLDYSGHYNRPDDINRFAELGIKKMRYPILWERHQPQKNVPIDWAFSDKQLSQLRLQQIDVIAGLVHHGSGPAYVNIMDDSFVDGLVAYAEKVACRYPWINYYTPVNEPLTTARFCGLYGAWHPHKKNDRSFCRILINECKATVLAMQAIRKINPVARLVQTEDLGETYSTPQLQYQADFENHRRWLSYDLLCGMVDKNHSLWNYLLSCGITETELNFFTDNQCPPDVMGFNHYLTSERYLDENLGAYPEHTHGGNFKHRYADVEAVRVGHVCPGGPYNLLKQAWQRYNLPIAVTEVHLYCTREEQMRWLSFIWETTHQLNSEGANIVAITPWAIFGAYGWNNLLTQKGGDYESGIFDLSGSMPRATALVAMIKAYCAGRGFDHPLLDKKGWWQRKCRVVYGEELFYNSDIEEKNIRPVFIIGKSGALSPAFSTECVNRRIDYKVIGDDITNQLDLLMRQENPWAIIDTSGFAALNDAEKIDNYSAIDNYNAQNVAMLCKLYHVKLLTFCTNLDFNEDTHSGAENDGALLLNINGQNRTSKQHKALLINPSDLVINVAVFCRSRDTESFNSEVSNLIKRRNHSLTVNDVTMSADYIHDMVNTSLNLMIDDEKGLWNLNGNGEIKQAELAFAAMESTELNLTEHIKTDDLFRLKAI